MTRLWATVEAVLDETRDIQLRQTLDHADLIRGVLEFANTGSLRTLGRQISGLPLPNGPVNLPAYQSLADEIALREGAMERQQLRADLAAIVALNEGHAGKRGDYDGPDLMKLVWPRLSKTGRLIVLTGPRGVHYLTANITAPLAYATALLLDGAFTGELCRCRLVTCEAFFLYSDKKRPKGRPFRFHCSTDHHEQDHNRRRGERPRKRTKSK